MEKYHIEKVTPISLSFEAFYEPLSEQFFFALCWKLQCGFLPNVGGL
jgi:hypothetical protein